jgi:putative membrane protein
MIHHFIHLVVYAVAVLIAARIVPGIHVRSFWSALFFAFIVAVLDKLLYGVLVFLSLPAIVITFGLFLVVINGFLFWLADKVVKGVEIDGFGSAMMGSLLTSVFSAGITWLLHMGPRAGAW